MSLEMVVKTDIENGIPNIVISNYEELKTGLVERLEQYKTRAVTKDSMREVETDMRTLNKVKEAIENKRKAVKKEYEKPYLAFKQEVDVLTKYIDDTRNVLNDQVKEIKKKEEDEKKEAIVYFYKTNIGRLMNLVPMEKILNPKWKNKGMALIDITGEMASKILEIEQNLKNIEGMKLNDEEEAHFKSIYLETLDFGKTMSEYNRIQEQKEKVKNITEKRIPQDHVAPLKKQKIEAAEEETQTVKVIFHNTTKAFRQDMKALTIKHSVKYGGIK